MSDVGLIQAREKMAAVGVDPVAIDVFAHYYGQIEAGADGFVPESTIESLDLDRLCDVEVDADEAREALAGTVVVKLNGGLGTSMGMTRAKSLLHVRDDLTFLDIIARQVLALRRSCDARLPLIFMDSFRTHEDTVAAMGHYSGIRIDGLPLDFLQNMEPRLWLDDLAPVTWPADPSLEWCPPGHGDLYTALFATGLLDRLAEAGYARVFVSNSDNLGAVPDPRVAGWFARSGAPFALEAVRRTASDRKGGHLARRVSDGRIVLRESAQTRPEDQAALANLSRHRYMNTNNLWFDIAAMKKRLDESGGLLGLALIKNVKSVDPSDPSTPKVLQMETAMGAAVEVFDGATAIEVERDRFVPVKTTNDLLVLRSDCYVLGEDYALHQVPDEIPFVDLGREYALLADYEMRFPYGAPSLTDARSLTVRGDWTFGRDVVVTGDAVVGGDGSTGRVEDGTTLGA